MGEPAETDKPEDTPGGRPSTPPGQGGDQPGNRPDVPPGHDQPEGDDGEPTHPIAEPEEEPQPEPVEALLGLREFQLVMPRRRSAAVTVAAVAGLRRWLQLPGHDVQGFYSMAKWQELYAEAMRYTG